MPLSALLAERHLDSRKIREVVQSHGVPTAQRYLTEQLREGTVRPEQFSLLALWEGFVGAARETLQHARASMAAGFVPAARETMQEAVGAAAFSYVTGNVITQAVIAAYEMRQSTLDSLVSPISSRFRVEPLVGFQASGSLLDVGEGEEYQDDVMAEKAVQAPEPVKRGRAITITEEAILYDQTGQILARARMRGDQLRKDRESRGMKRIQDLANPTPPVGMLPNIYKCYYPIVSGSPTQTDLYRTAAGSTSWHNRTINSLASTALTDWTSLDAAMALFASMTDENGDPIVIEPNTLLVPYALWSTAHRIVNAIEVWNVTGTATRTTVSPNVVRTIAGTLIPLWSPYMNDTTTWYLGDPKSQFQERIIIPGQVVELPPDKRRDMLTGFVVRHKSQVEATDDKAFLKVTA